MKTVSRFRLMEVHKDTFDVYLINMVFVQNNVSL